MTLGTCTIRGCDKDAVSLYPLLPGGPRFCGEHHTPEHAGPFGCDFTGPDDFDIPVESWGDYAPTFSRKTFVWTSKDGEKFSLCEISDGYLANIVGFLDRMVAAVPDEECDPVTEQRYDNEQYIAYWSAVLDFLREEQGIRAKGDGGDII